MTTEWCSTRAQPFLLTCEAKTATRHFTFTFNCLQMPVNLGHSLFNKGGPNDTSRHTTQYASPKHWLRRMLPDSKFRGATFSAWTAWVGLPEPGPWQHGRSVTSWKDQRT